MTDTQQDFTYEELVRLTRRDRFVKDQLSQRVMVLLRENLDLVAVVQELQTDLAAANARLAELTATSNGEVEMPVDVAS